MARRGLFGRALDWLTGSGRPATARQPPQESSRTSEPPEPPREPPRQSGGSGDTFRDVFNDDVPRALRQRISDDTGYSANEVFQAHYELFASLPGVQEDDREEQLRLWDIYLEHMVATDEIRNDPSNPFWSEFGLDPRDVGFDWDEWRNAMGYSRRGK